jgi:hypothetical protein
MKYGIPVKCSSAGFGLFIRASSSGVVKESEGGCECAKGLRMAGWSQEMNVAVLCRILTIEIVWPAVAKIVAP